MSPDFADDKLASVADGGGAREVRDFLVRNFRGVGEFVGESAKAGPEDERDAAAEVWFWRE